MTQSSNKCILPTGNVMVTVVPCPKTESSEMESPNFPHSFLHINNPIPVDFAKLRPFSPVNPCSNTHPMSCSAMPLQLSCIRSETCCASFSAVKVRRRGRLGD